MIEKELNKVPASVEYFPEKPVEVPRFENKKSDDNKSINANKNSSI